MEDGLDEMVEELVKDLKKNGHKVIAYGRASDLIKLMEEGEFSEKTKEEGK